MIKKRLVNAGYGIVAAGIIAGAVLLGHCIVIGAGYILFSAFERGIQVGLATMAIWVVLLGAIGGAFFWNE